MNPAEKNNRRSILSWWIWAAAILLFTGQAAAPAPLPPAALIPVPAVQGLIDQVQSGTLYTYVAGLSGEQAVTIGGASYTLSTRSTTAAASIEKATQYAFEHFSSLGLTVSYHYWQYGSGQRRNVVAEQMGTNPGCLYLLTAHLDDYSQTPSTYAPGADDNASGVAGVFVAADILSRARFTCSLQYVLFTGEEQGFLGSEAYAEAAAARGDPIQGVINLDMIAYNTPGSAATIEMDIRSGTSGNADRVLSNRICDVIQAYGLGLSPLVYASNDDGSDQYSFWMAGFPAVEVIEDWGDHSPHYHTTADRIGTLNMPYFTEYVKAVVGTMAHLGQLRTSFPIYLPFVRKP